MGTMDDAPPAPASRFPRWVYGVGSEPDARFSLANERTFLAWVRTALALLASGVALEALDLPIEEHLRFTAALVLVGVGVVAPVLAWLGWARAERAVRLRDPLPAPSSFGLLVVGVLVAGALVLVGMVLA
jgi:putative membrane protein